MSSLEARAGAPPPDDPRFRFRPEQQATASCSGALITSLFMTPLDVVKIRLQAQQKALLSNKCYLYCNGLMDHLCLCGPGMTSTNARKLHFNGTLDAMMKITKYEGFTSLWSGLSPTLVLAVPCTVVYFVLYEQMRVELMDRYSLKTGKYEQPMWIPLLSGAAGRTAAVTIFNPLELVRTKMQSQKMTFSETRVAVYNMLESRGIAGLWRGLGSTLMRDVPFSAIYWMNYETIKQRYGNRDPKKNGFTFNFIAGGISGSAAALVTLPFDVVKTHQQIELGEKEIYSESSKQKAKSTLEMLKNIYRMHGVSGLFTGTIPRIIKVAPACAIMIASFEYGKSFFQDYNRKQYLDAVES
ncbi:solute carrier family 25 protein Shawn-like isoform X2 [Arctopsyche grandis]|uniref:solute carrier family 25 protein Shawn-like isoform X2 n=1 Tax=Arctopsyche grandis TaxID=121162 RepID=UPI00406D70BC